MFQAAYNGHDELIKFLVAKGSDVDGVNQWKCTPIIAAALKGHVETVKTLATLGANLSLRNVEACKGGLLETFDLTVKVPLGCCI